MSINNRIEKLIGFSQLSATEFAEKIAVQRSSISHILSGRNKPSLDFLIKIKEAFPKISWDWLITGHGEMEILEVPIEEKVQELRTPLPDLFTFVSDENPVQEQNKNYLLENLEPKIEIQENSPKLKTGNKKIQKIILLYEDGCFESFNPNL